MRVLVDGQPLIMRAGSKQRIPRTEPNRMAFEQFEVDNLDEDIPIQVVFVVGVGDYDETIISGNVRAESLVMTALGAKPDSRYTIDAIIQPGQLITKTLTQGDIILEKDSGLAAIAGSDVVFHGELGLVAYQDAFSGDVQLYDTELNLVKTAPRIAPPSGNPANDFAYIEPLGGYVGLGGSFTGIKNKLYDNLGQEIMDLNPLGVDTLRRVAYVPKENLLVFSDSVNNKIIFTDIQGSVIVAEVAHSMGAGDPMRYDHIEGKVYSYGSSGSLKIIDPVDFSSTDHTVSYPLANGTSSPYWVVTQKRVIGFSADDKTRLRKVAGIDFTTKPSFEVYNSQFDSLRKQTKIQTTAALSVSEKTDGVAVSGEVIKTILESYFMQKVESRYLDSVYSFDMGRGPKGNHQNVKTTGARTFALQGVKDNFEVFAPTKVRITIDSNVPLGAFLL